MKKHEMKKHEMRKHEMKKHEIRKQLHMRRKIAHDFDEINLHLCVICFT